MSFLYGNHVLKNHLGRITEDTPEHQGVVVYSMNDVPLVRDEVSCCFLRTKRCIQGFGVTSRSTIDTRKLDPAAIIVFHQAYALHHSFFEHALSAVLGMLASIFVMRCALQLISVMNYYS